MIACGAVRGRTILSVNAIESFRFFLKIKKSGFLKIEMQHTCVRGYLRFACNIRFGTERRCAEQCAKVNPRAERWPIARKHLNAGTIFLNFIGQFCINMYVGRNLWNAIRSMAVKASARDATCCITRHPSPARALERQNARTPHTTHRTSTSQQ